MPEIEITGEQRKIVLGWIKGKGGLPIDTGRYSDAEMFQVGAERLLIQPTWELLIFSGINAYMPGASSVSVDKRTGKFLTDADGPVTYLLTCDDKHAQVLEKAGLIGSLHSQE